MQECRNHILLPDTQVTAMLSYDVDRIAQHSSDGARRIQRVLVAFDGSDGAWAALDRAIALALTSNAQLTIAGVVPPPPPLACGMPGALMLPYSRDDLQRELDNQMLQHLAAARDEIPATVSVTTRLLHGHPTRALARLAEEGRYDLVVTGPRRTTRLGRLFHHSVTHGLLSHGSISVLAVKPS
jgi:nucleotide-binding universal stress UspA family protein